MKNKTPLMKAISNGHLHIVAYLLDAGADVTKLSWDKDSVGFINIYHTLGDAISCQ